MTDTNVWFLQRSRTYRIELFFDKDIKKKVEWHGMQLAFGGFFSREKHCIQ